MANEEYLKTKRAELEASKKAHAARCKNAGPDKRTGAVLTSDEFERFGNNKTKKSAVEEATERAQVIADKNQKVVDVFDPSRSEVLFSVNPSFPG